MTDSYVMVRSWVVTVGQVWLVEYLHHLSVGVCIMVVVRLRVQQLVKRRVT